MQILIENIKNFCEKKLFPIIKKGKGFDPLKNDTWNHILKLADQYDENQIKHLFINYDVSWAFQRRSG